MSTSLLLRLRTTSVLRSSFRVHVMDPRDLPSSREAPRFSSFHSWPPPSYRQENQLQCSKTIHRVPGWPHPQTRPPPVIPRGPLLRCPTFTPSCLFMSPPPPIIRWPSSESSQYNASRDYRTMSCDHVTMSCNCSITSHDRFIEGDKGRSHQEKKQYSFEVDRSKPSRQTAEKSYTHSPSSQQREERERHQSRLRPPLRPEVTANRSKRDINGSRYPLFSLVCYNVLSQDLISQNMYLYDKEQPQWLDWEYRKRRMIKELLDTEADIMCLQEVFEDHYYDWYKRKLESHGYHGLYLKRTGNCKDGCAIFYYSKVIQLVDHNYVTYQKQKGTLDRDNVGLIAKFRLRTSHHTSSNFLVANTHILFNPKAGEAKLAQICYLLAELHKMATTSSTYLPCILCGDFNSLPHSPFIQFLLSGRLDYTDLSATAIAGYRYSAPKHRHIPNPVIHPDIGIGHNCQYQTPNKLTINEAQSSVIEHNIEPSTVTTTSEPDAPPKRKRFRTTTSPVNKLLPAILTHSFDFTSCYPIAMAGTLSPTVTTYHRAAAETVDYILCTTKGGRWSSGFHVVRRQALPSFNTLQRLGPQPNKVLSSDHLYLSVELQLIN